MARCRSSLVLATCVLSLMLAASVVLAATTEELEKRGQEKLAYLLNESKSRPVIRVDGNQFTDLVAQGPRPYNLVVVLTAHSARCGLCDSIRPEYAILARAFEKTRYKGEDKEPTHTLFFLELDANKNYEFFQQLGYQTIPHMMFVKATKSPRRVHWQTLLSDKLMIGSGPTADEMRKMLGSRVDVQDVVIERPPEQTDFVSLFLLIVGGGGTILVGSTIGKPIVDRYVRNTTFFLIVSLVFYGFCISGGMYNRIREVPFVHTTHEGQTEVIHSSSGTQFGLEGYIIGCLNLAIALSIIVLNDNLSHIKFIKNSSLPRNTLVVVSLLSFYFFFHQLRYIYSWKNGGYNMGWVWG